MFHMWEAQIGMGWWMAFGGIWMVVLWGGLISLIVWGVKNLVERPSSRHDVSEKHQPLDLAKERYTKGEISRDEFEQIRKDLS